MAELDGNYVVTETGQRIIAPVDARGRNSGLADFEFEEIGTISAGGNSAIRSFAGYRSGSLTVQIVPGSTAAGSAVIQMMCRDTANGAWVPFGSQVTISIGSGGATVSQRLTWSNQVTRDVRLNFVSTTIAGTVLSEIDWRFG